MFYTSDFLEDLEIKFMEFELNREVSRTFHDCTGKSSNFIFDKDHKTIYILNKWTSNHVKVDKVDKRWIMYEDVMNKLEEDNLAVMNKIGSNKFYNNMMGDHTFIEDFTLIKPMCYLRGEEVDNNWDLEELKRQIKIHSDKKIKTFMNGCPVYYLILGS